ncbi:MULTISPECIES: NAD(P)-binding domain-containing protein [Agrobacterium tumefaciens complex]|jgi:pyrroline-5-carboxylate reductase|uniref:NAD(P)-binding domain-containing protein n=1 Tax=Agrobacterium tumefaciens TaxID=358 RepID=UPI000FE28CD2|nr:NAD(P)-binding domain-containing protein [Agrobacterium tumefaciens]QAB00926.1 pyrroline-5-carboxylate reductase [Agrobacterium tumefaciens]
MNIGFIGAGAITEAIVTGLLRTSHASDTILVSARNAEIAARLATMSSNVKIVDDNQKIVEQSEVALLAVRPQIARSVLRPLQFPRTLKVISLIATVPAVTVQGWIGDHIRVVRAIPLPSVADLVGVTAIYPRDQVVEDLFRSLGKVVTAESLQEFDGYAATSALMGTYFGLLETSAIWMTERGASYERAQNYLTSLFLVLQQQRRPTIARFQSL